MTAKELIMKLPEKFVAESVAPDAETVFHFRIKGEGGGDFTARIKDQKCEVVEGLEGDAKCVVKASDKNLLKVVNKELNAQMAVFTGKLKISNLGEMMKYAKTFGLM